MILPLPPFPPDASTIQWDLDAGRVMRRQGKRGQNTLTRPVAVYLHLFLEENTDRQPDLNAVMVALARNRVIKSPRQVSLTQISKSVDEQFPRMRLDVMEVTAI